MHTLNGVWFKDYWKQKMAIFCMAVLIFMDIMNFLFVSMLLVMQHFLFEHFIILCNKHLPYAGVTKNIVTYSAYHCVMT